MPMHDDVRFVLGCASSRYEVFCFLQAEDGIRDLTVTGVQTCALPILSLNRFIFCSSPQSGLTVTPADAPSRSMHSLIGVESKRIGRTWRARARSGLAGFGTEDRKSTRLNSSHSQISYAVFCLKKKKR